MIPRPARPPAASADPPATQISSLWPRTPRQRDAARGDDGGLQGGAGLQLGGGGGRQGATSAPRGPGPARGLRRERVNARTGHLADGGFSTSAAPALAEAETAAGPGAEGQEARPAGLAAAAPAVPPISEASLAALTAFVEQSRRLVVVTGAGVSTESNLPDYRGPRGAYSTGFKPMTHQQFLKGAAQRRRYWARSFFGWPEFTSCVPNAGHEALARLEELGKLRGGIITQNVDRLHQRAGSGHVLELHGTTHEVQCLGCGALSCRHEFQRTLADLNPEAAAEVQRMLAQQAGGDPWDLNGGLSTPWRRALKDWTLEPPAEPQQPSALLHPSLRRPDGDTEIAKHLVDNFKVPACDRCGDGILKPHVVFFGDNLPPGRKEEAQAMVEGADACLVVGSSLMVFSAFRLAKAASRKGIPLAILTAGETRADDLAQIKVAALAGEALPRLLRAGSIPVPGL